MQIPTALKVLLDDTQYWIENKTYTAAEIAIRFKHRLVSIHCFPNGNGRHSRMMADLIIETIFTEKLFTWNSSNMVKSDDIRKEYIAALKQADVGNIDPLLQFALH
jgi:Fic-DOC domain mobile mystery protein B